MIKIKTTGDFVHTDRFFKRIKEQRYVRDLEKYGEECVKLLSEATPKDSGLTASSWRYTIEKTNDGFYRIGLSNDNISDGCLVAVLIQYGHATKSGGYVEGIDYINPVVTPIFEKITEDAWKEVTSK